MRGAAEMRSMRDSRDVAELQRDVAEEPRRKELVRRGVYLGCISAVSRLQLGCSSAAARLHFSAASLALEGVVGPYLPPSRRLSPHLASQVRWGPAESFLLDMTAVPRLSQRRDLVEITAEIQPRYSRDTAEVQPRCTA